MLLPEILRWAAVAALAAAAVRFPRPAAFWSHSARQPLVLARVAVGPERFRRAAPR